jgi:Uma2 family endonuclease
VIATHRFTVKDLERMKLEPLDDTRYEIIDGELHVSTQPHRFHQYTADSFVYLLRGYGGFVLGAPGIIYAEDEAVAPDVVWYASRERFERAVGVDEKLHDAPDLVIEVLSPGRANERRDLEDKLAVYDRRGAQEYWIADWRARTVRVHRRDVGGLTLVATLTADDALESPLLPGFSVRVAELFPPV